METIIIAIDGHSSCGKSTLAKALAKKLGFVYIDTGAMYRAVTLYAMQNGIFETEKANEQQLMQALSNIDITFKLIEQKPHTFLNGQDVENAIRSIEVSQKVSEISAMPFVRMAMVDLQRKMAQTCNVVMDGRDIGTVVFPNAQLKIFVTASPQIRAQRRYDELKSKGEDVSFEQVYENLKKRDLLDSTRQVAPLRKAEDAILLDNSNLTIEGQFQYALGLAESIINKV